MGWHNKKTLLEENEHHSLWHYLTTTYYSGCQCYKDCLCKEDFVPQRFSMWVVIRKNFKTSQFLTYEEARHRYDFLISNCNPKCPVGVHYNRLNPKDLKKAKELWSQLGDIPIDTEECIEEFFLGFPVGTHREIIWEWFEDNFNLSVAEDLMFSE